MRVGGFGIDSRGRLESLLGCVNRDLERLSINNGSFHIVALAHLDRLRRLVIIGGILYRDDSTSTPALSLPSLHHLEIRHTSIQDPAAFFSPNVLPALVSLSLEKMASRQLLRESLLSIASRVKALDIDFPLRIATAAVLYSFDNFSPSAPFPANHSRAIGLPTVRFTHVDLVRRAWEQRLGGIIVTNATRRSEVIFLDESGVSRERVESREYAAAIDMLTSQGARVERGRISFFDAVERVERILAREKEEVEAEGRDS